MKAWTYHRYGGPEVLELVDVPDPVPRDDEVLVRVRATTVTAGDWRARTALAPRGYGTMARLVFGVRGPRKPILGLELAGVVERVGARVTRFRPGDAVFGSAGGKMGAHAELCALPEDGPLAPKPEGLSFEEAAALTFGGSTALQYLQKGDVQAGESILIIGASGNVGTMLVQLAKHRGAEVTAATSAGNADLVRSLGATRVVDYQTEDPLKAGPYDVIADTVGETTYAQARPALKDKGRLLSIAGDLSMMLASLRGAREGGRRVVAGPALERREDVEELARLAGSRALKAVIDRRYAFSEMREAHALVDSRRKKGSVVVTVGEGLASGLD